MSQRTTRIARPAAGKHPFPRTYYHHSLTSIARNQTIGSGKESLGNLIGHEGLKNEGRQQNAEGQAQQAGGQLNDLGSGMMDRAKGSVGGAVAGLTGDNVEKARYQAQHDQGKTLQRGVESELNKKA